MGKVVMPKNSALENEILAVLKIYYEEGDWLKNSDYVERLKKIIGDGQYSSSYTKKSQMTSYFGFTTWEDYKNNQSRRRITERGKKFYLAWSKNNSEEMHEQIILSIEENIFGRRNCGCSESDSDIEVPSLVIRAILDLGYITYKEFALLLWNMEHCGKGYTDAIVEVKNSRSNGQFQLSSDANKYTDAKPIMMMIRWGVLQEDGKVGSNTKIIVNPSVMKKYKKRLLNLKIYNVDKYFSNIKDEYSNSLENVNNYNISYNKIVFGAPGTGKSNLIERERKEYFGENYERVTFHPNYTYSQFVGTYKPVQSVDSNGNDSISYEYVPGPFIRILTKALLSKKNNENEPFLLIIEEINRANVASVFGDVFQLLDRKNGESQYDIAPSQDMKVYLKSKLGGELNDYEKIKIPSNMYIWATMNSADQGVFPMDTAFKRRWDFQYIDIDEKDEEIKGIKVLLGEDKHIVEWNILRKAINEMLLRVCNVNEDKLLGPYFISKSILEVGEDNLVKDNDKFINYFKNKVIMYLYEDAAGRQHRNKIFTSNTNAITYSSVCKEFDKVGEKVFGENLNLSKFEEDKK